MPGTQTAFTESLEDRGYEYHRRKHARGFKGINMRTNNAPGEG